MPAQIQISKRRPDGSVAKVTLACYSVFMNGCDKKEAAEMLLEAEMNGNSSGKIRVHFSNFGRLPYQAV